MKTAFLLILAGGIALFAWSLSRLSSDAIALAMGLTLGVLSLPVSLWVVSLGARRDAEDERQPTIIEYPARPAITYADEVTPYYRLARRGLGLPALPDRQVMAPQLPTRRQIAEVRAYLDAVEAGEVDAW